MTAARGKAAAGTATRTEATSTSTSVFAQLWTLFGAFAAAVLLALATPSPVLADSAAFERGVDAARAGDYAAAVAHFRAARESGLDTPALHFNLGVALYRLGRLDQATQSFRRAADSPEMGGPAAYNLGRIARERGDYASAQRWFEAAAERARTSEIRQRARAALQPERQRPALIGSGAIGLGYDSNIALAPADPAGASRESDRFVLAQGYVQRDWLDDGYVFASAYAERYANREDFDLGVLQAGAGSQSAESAWPGLRLSLRHTRFGGEAFDNAVLVDLRFAPLPADGPELEIGVDGFRGADGRDYLDGHRLRLDGSWERSVLGGQWSLGVALARVERSDLTVDDDFYSYSYLRRGVRTRYRRSLTTGSSFAVGAGWTRSRYADAEIEAGDSLGRRDDSVQRLALELEQTIATGWRLAGRLERERRRSNIDGYDYERTVLTTRITRQF